MESDREGSILFSCISSKEEEISGQTGHGYTISFDKLKERLRLMLLVAHCNKEGCPVNQIEEEYRIFFNEVVICQQYDYVTWKDLLKRIDNEVNLSKSQGVHIAKRIPFEHDTHGSVKQYLTKIFPSTWIKSSDSELDHERMEQLRLILLLEFGIGGCKIAAMNNLYEKYFGEEIYQGENTVSQ